MGNRAKLHALIDELPDEELPGAERALKAARGARPCKGNSTLLELAGDLAGSLRGGPPDLATNPNHLSDFGQ